MVARFTRKDFLEAVFSQYYRDHRGFILVKSFKRGDPKMSTRYFPTVEILSKEQYGEDRDIYFGICPRERMKPEKEHILYITALWADLDIGPAGHEGSGFFYEGPEQAARAIRTFPKPPSIAVDSGRGLHLYWLLEKVVEIDNRDKVENILRTVQSRLRCKQDTGLDTQMRLPDTLNNKVPSDPLRCRVTFINQNFRYSLADFQDLGSSAVSVASPLENESQVPTRLPDMPRLSQGSSKGDLGKVLPSPVEQPMDSYEQGDPGDQDGHPTENIPSNDPRLGEGLSLSPETVEFVSEAVRPGQKSWAGERPPKVYTQEIDWSQNLPKESLLGKLISDRTEVEISLRGTESLMRATLLGNEHGMILCRSGDRNYVVPLSSVSFISYRAD